MKHLVILVFLFSFSTFLSAQVAVSGRLIDKDTGEPIQFSNVFLQKHQGIGTATNENGYFSFKLPKWVKPTDSIVFSSIAYCVVKVPLNVFVDSIGFTEFFIEPLAYQIQPVQISAPSERAKQIVWAAVKNRKRTFNRRLHVLNAFFREIIINREDSTYSSLAEADISILDYGIRTTNSSTKILVNEFRRADDFRPQFYKNPHIKRLSASFNRSNSIYNAYYNVFKHCEEGKCFSSKKFLNENDFFFMKEIYAGTDTIDVIGFTPKRLRLAESKGNLSIVTILHINRTDKGILKYENRWDLSHGSFYYTTQIFEKNIDGLYYPKIFISDYSFASKIIYIHGVSRKRVDKRRVNWGETEKRTDDIFDKEYTYNPQFWENYSTIEIIPAPQKLQQDLERDRKLLDQFSNPK